MNVKSSYSIVIDGLRREITDQEAAILYRRESLALLKIETKEMIDKFYNFIEKYADFEGRSGRLEYIKLQIIFITSIVLYIVIYALVKMTNLFLLEMIIYGTLVFYIPLAIYLRVATHVRRLHDLGLSGYFLFLQFFPIGLFIIVALIFCPGNKRANGFGAIPK